MRIFVAIASYCDDDCANTVADLFQKAAEPSRVNIGICWQYAPDNQPMLCPVPADYARQVRQSSHHYTQSQGAGWARSHACKLWDGEDIILLLDAHMRFVEGWDSLLLRSLEACPHDNVVLTANCPGFFALKPGYDSPNIIRITVQRLASEDSAQQIHLGGRWHKGTLPPRPFLSGSIVFNFVAARAEIFKRVPIDPHIYFHGAETTQAARFWTRGIDMYQPNQLIAFHEWIRPPSIYKQSSQVLAIQSRSRVRYLLGLQSSAPSHASKDIDLYSMGTARALDDYFAFLGVDLRAQAVSEKAKRGLWDDVLTAENYSRK